MMMHNRNRCIMMLLGIAAMVGMIWIVMMGMEKTHMDPEGTFVKMMDHMNGMMS